MLLNEHQKKFFLPTTIRRMIQIEAKQPKKKTNKVLHSIEEFEAHFFPRVHEEQIGREKMPTTHDPTASALSILKL
jgi:hypothetical protein